LDLYRDSHGIKTIVAHSLGSSVAIALLDLYENRNISGRLYASPSIFGGRVRPSWAAPIMFYRHRFDPISGLNMMSNLEQTSNIRNPHAYSGY
jgi:hypothetical protein